MAAKNFFNDVTEKLNATINIQLEGNPDANKTNAENTGNTDQPAANSTDPPTLTSDASLMGLPAWLKIIIKVATVFCGVLAMLCGILSLFRIPTSLGGFLIIAFEAPMLCTFVKFIDPIRNFSQARKPLEKVIIYVVPPIIVLILCQELTTIFGSLALLAIAAMYFVFFIK